MITIESKQIEYSRSRPGKYFTGYDIKDNGKCFSYGSNYPVMLKIAAGQVMFNFIKGVNV